MRCEELATQGPSASGAALQSSESSLEVSLGSKSREPSQGGSFGGKPSEPSQGDASMPSGKKRSPQEAAALVLQAMEQKKIRKSVAKSAGAPAAAPVDSRQGSAAQATPAAKATPAATPIDSRPPIDSRQGSAAKADPAAVPAAAAHKLRPNRAESQDMKNGWRMEIVWRQSGSTAGQRDRYFIGPDGERCRSKKEVEKLLETGVLSPW